MPVILTFIPSNVTYRNHRGKSYSLVADAPCNINDRIPPARISGNEGLAPVPDSIWYAYYRRCSQVTLNVCRAVTLNVTAPLTPKSQFLGHHQRARLRPQLVRIAMVKFQIKSPYQRFPAEPVLWYFIIHQNK